ncbi:hypothetical protein [Muricoccus radiodurans]|uniref:hypothetical protein n=1 Tax=Muricoccus radiodurans TaxID=2231721 RepID=UPI003CFB84F9
MRLFNSVTMLVASTGLILALGGPAGAQSSSSSSSAEARGPNASASASAGSGTSGPCREITPEEAARGGGAHSSVTTGPGGLSGSATAGPNGPRVTIGPSGGTPGPGGGAHATARSDCVVVVPR